MHRLSLSSSKIFLSLQEKILCPLRSFSQPRAVAHACNPNTSGGWGGWARSSRSAWPKWWNPISTKNSKISWVWWLAPVIPATQEAKGGESLEPRRRRLQWAEIEPLHSRLGNKSKTLSPKKKKKQCSNSVVIRIKIKTTIRNHLRTH